MSGTLIPRLGGAEAIQLFSDLEKQLGDGCPAAELVSTEELGVVNPTGGPAPDARQIQQWRSDVMTRLRGIDMHDPGGQPRFGLALGRAISDVIAPIKADAAHEGVWTYLALRVFPDVLYARWPGDIVQGQVKLPPDRWLGASGYRDRNYLKVTWRRWMVMGDIMETADPLLGEDEFLQLFGRSALARNKRLIREAARAILEFGSDQSGSRSYFSRDLMKAICSRSGAVFLDVLDDDDTRDFVQQQAVGLLRSRGRRAAA